MAGGSTQLKGVVPDIVIHSVLDVLEIGEDYLPHAMPWSMVGMARYLPVADLGPLIPELRKRSEERRAKDPRFAAEASMIARIKKRVESSEISLNLDERIALAHEEKGMEKIQAEALDDEEPEALEEGKKTKDTDIVLTETEHVMCDLITLTGKEESGAHED